MTNRTSLVHHLLLLVGTCLLASIPVSGAETCPQGSKEWENIDKWKDSKGSLDMDKDLGTCTPKEPDCFAALLILPKVFNVEKIFMYRGCNDDAWTAHLTKIMENNSGGISGRQLSVPQAFIGGRAEPEHGCGFFADATLGMLMLICVYKPTDAPKKGAKIEDKCLPAFPNDVKKFRENPVAFPTEDPWKCGDVPTPGKSCEQGSNEWANVDKWKESGGSWDITTTFKRADKICVLSPSKPVCIGTLLLLPKEISGDKIIMYRGCPDYPFEAYLRGILSQNRGGRKELTGRAGSGEDTCAMLAVKTDDGTPVLMMSCVFKSEAAPKKTGDKIDGKCLTAFHKDASNFRANPKSFPLDKVWACGDKVGAGTGTRSDMKTVFLIAILTCLVSYFWNHLPLLSD